MSERSAARTPVDDFRTDQHSNCTPCRKCGHLLTRSPNVHSMGLRRQRTRYSPVRNYHIKSLDVSYNRLTLEKFFTTFPRRQRRGRWAGDGTPVCRCMQGAVNNRISSLENTAPSGSLCDRCRRCGASYLLVSLPDTSVRLD